MAVRESLRLAREQQRAADAAIRASAAQRTAAQRAARLANIAAREAAAEERNAQLAVAFDEIDNLLNATLDVDDWVDLESLRESASSLPFDRPELLVLSAVPHYRPLLDRPSFVAPTPQSGLSGALGGNRKRSAQLATAQQEHLRLVRQWEQILIQTCAANAELRAQWRQREAARTAELDDARRRHERAETERRHRINESNARLDQLIAGLRERKPSAMDEYVGIVLANSIYPETFEVSYEHSFDATDQELRITVLAPRPDAFLTTKSFRYNKTNDEITATALPMAERKRRYASAIAQTALRTVHEVFEADRAAIIDSIALTVAVNAVDGATGHDTRTDLLQLATDRADFLALDLARVDPKQTLAHLSAAVSPNPFGLVPLADHGVRG
ncbi:hypothetical protein [Nocardia callitridis]|uniref:hypothetical protein n=1 Tax=Nocardia callitridis TaxID=648753 RepID=UPI0031EE0770